MANLVTGYSLGSNNDINSIQISDYIDDVALGLFTNESNTLKILLLMRIKNDLEFHIGKYQSRATCFDIILTEA